MIFPTALSSMLQVVAALLIFIAGYLALVVCAIIGLVITEFSTENGDMDQAYGAKRT